jgi:mannosyl-oligosaccharide alpha-1,2-mannosidase
MKASNKQTLQRVFLWLGALFLSWHVVSLLFSGGSSKPSQSKLEESSNSVKTPGDAQRAAAIVDAFRFSWDKYEKYAAPHDTLLPVSKTYEDDRYVQCRN